MVVVKEPMLTRVVAFVSLGRYLRKRSRPSASITSSRGSDVSFVVRITITLESMLRKFPCGDVRLKISAKKRGDGEFIESQHGILNAKGLLPGIELIKSTHA